MPQAERLYDPDSERLLVGWLLARPERSELVTDTVTAADMADPAASVAFLELMSRGKILYQRLADLHPELFMVGELRAWAHAARYREPVEIEDAAIRVAERATVRRLILGFQTGIDEAQDPRLDLTQVIERARSRAADIDAPGTPPPDLAEDGYKFMEGFTEQRDWLIPDMIVRRERIMLTATGGVGKSTMLRQLAACGAAGRHPFMPKEMLPRPLRVLLLDLENEKHMVQRKLRDPFAQLEKLGHFDRTFIHIVAHPKLMDVTTTAGKRWLWGQADHVEPDLIVAGPVYRMYESGDTSKDMGGRDKARRVADILDGLRDRHNCSLVIEAHPPKGSLSLSPFGAAVWEWWADQGLGMQPSKDQGAKQVRLQNWRYDRDDRNWPTLLERGGIVGWLAREYRSRTFTGPLPSDSGYHDEGAW